MSNEVNRSLLVGDDSKTPDYTHTDCDKCKDLGTCIRHPTIDKSNRDFLICKGSVGAKQRIRFVKGWDRQQKEQLNCCPNQKVYERTMSFAKAMMKWAKSAFSQPTQKALAHRRAACNACPYQLDGKCQICSCNIEAKTALSTESCPLGLWTTSFEPLHRPIPSDALRKNLLFHLFPTKENEELLRWHAKVLKDRLQLFNGVKSIGVVEDRAAINSRTLHIDKVREIFEGIFDNWIVMENNPNRREGVTFAPLMNTVPQKDCDNDITFYCHGKGARHKDGGTPAISRWISTMYELLLDDWPIVHTAINEAIMVGLYKQYNMFRLKENHGWCYSGTFFWFRNKEIFEVEDWQRLHPFFACVEAWPGNVCKASDTSCLFRDNDRNMYNEELWEGKIDDLLAKRKTAICTMAPFLESVSLELAQSPSPTT